MNSMKKKILLFIFMLMVMPLGVFANSIYKIDMDIYIDEEGNASITETWDVRGNNGSEWYKAINDFGDSRVSDFKVMMDSQELTYKNWDINESLSQKKGYYGINYTADGVELCFGKYDYNRHTFVLTYKVSNVIFNTDDAQVLYYKFIDKLSNVSFGDFTLNVRSYYDFPDTLDVWGYGYRGYAYVENSKISMSNDGIMDDNYVVLLVKFPQNTFNISQRIAGYDTFQDVLDTASSGSYDYDYDGYGSKISRIISKIFEIMCMLLPFLIFGLITVLTMNSGYGYKGNKTINKKNTPMFRDIPCNKNIYYANTLMDINKFGYKDTNILGAIILKWIKENKVNFKTSTTGLFNKENNVLDLTMKPTFDNEYEDKLFNMMYEASEDGILERKELEKWCRKNYTEFLGFFTDLTRKEINKLKTDGHIYKRTSKEECKKKMVLDDKIYEDSKQLYGLKLYLEEFARMDLKEAMEVHLWDEYLMFAYLFGIADKVMKQFKNLYPEVIEQMEQSNLDLNTLVFINNISTRSVTAASSARSAAESYSSGGGGYSSGGGGGGSFGGGGGGSR